MRTYGKISLSDRIKNKFWTKKNKKIILKKSIETYGVKYALPIGALIGFMIDRTLLIKTKGLYAFVPFSFTIFFATKMLIKFTKSNEVKRLNMFKVIDEVRF